MIVNQSGTEKEIITIGIYPNPRCFRNKPPPLQCYSIKKVWMTSEIWETIITKFNSKMQRNGHNILLFCDNAFCHKLNCELSNTKFIFMPSNSISLIQSLDQGFIRTVKVYLRTQFIRQMAIAIDNCVKPDDFARSISVLKALYMSKRAFFLLTPSTIYNCFRKTGFVLHVLRQEQREIEAINIPEANPPEELTAQEFNEFVDIDSGEQCSGVVTDHEICAEICGQVLLADDGEEEPEIEVDAEEAAPTRQDALKMLHSPRLLCSTFEDKDQVLEKIDCMELSVERGQCTKPTQLSVFFRK